MDCGWPVGSPDWDARPAGLADQPDVRPGVLLAGIICFCFKMGVLYSGHFCTYLFL